MTTNTIPIMTEETVRDLIALLTKHPDLRKEVKKALFPNLDLENALEELTSRVNKLAQAQERTEVSLQQLSSRVEQLASHVLDLEIAQRRTEATLQQLIETQQLLLKRVGNLEIRLEKVEIRLETLEKKVDTGFAKLTSLIGQLGSRWGIYNESIWQQTIATLIEKIYGDRVEERHIAGEQFDVVISNGDHILLEITARFKSHDFHKMERKRSLYTTHVQAPARFIVAAASIHSRQARKLEEAGYELVEPEEDI